MASASGDALYSFSETATRSPAKRRKRRRGKLRRKRRVRVPEDAAWAPAKDAAEAVGAPAEAVGAPAEAEATGWNRRDDGAALPGASLDGTSLAGASLEGVAAAWISAGGGRSAGRLLHGVLRKVRRVLRQRVRQLLDGGLAGEVVKPMVVELSWMPPTLAAAAIV